MCHYIRLDNGQVRRVEQSTVQPCKNCEEEMQTQRNPNDKKVQILYTFDNNFEILEDADDDVIYIGSTFEENNKE